jgi:lysozyme family protein
MATTEELKNVPEHRVAAKVRQYELVGATVEKRKQPNGKWTIIATFGNDTDGMSAAVESADDAVAPIVETEPSPLPAPTSSKVFADLADEYRAYFEMCKIREDKLEAVDVYCDRLLKNKGRYEDLGAKLSIPWYFIGAIHSLESDCSFKCHLHNGDPLDALTVRVPVGRPQVGAPPFLWEESAEDVLTIKALDDLEDWSISRTLFRWEAYNGFGYRLRQLPSPYLWSFSNLYERGKFVADHQFDPDAVSAQCGAATIFKRLMSRGDLRLDS